MKFRIATWNINSVRARIAIVEQFLQTYRPDVLCLQETKVSDDLFPAKAFKKLGYNHIAAKGQKSHHGVATISKFPLESIERLDWCGKGDARHVGVALPGGVRLENFYVPAGGDVPDAGANEKFAHKLQFFDEMINWSDQISAPSILVGDLNVAPLPEDVWDHKALLKVVSHTPIEVEKMDQLMGAHSWHDPVRAQAGDDAKLFSWWSYRARDWEASDRGRRLDHVWVSPSLKKAVQRTEVLKPVRGWEKPSDHAPIIADFEI